MAARSLSTGSQRVTAASGPASTKPKAGPETGQGRTAGRPRACQRPCPPHACPGRTPTSPTTYRAATKRVAAPMPGRKLRAEPSAPSTIPTGTPDSHGCSRCCCSSAPAPTPPHHPPTLTTCPQPPQATCPRGSSSKEGHTGAPHVPPSTTHTMPAVQPPCHMQRRLRPAVHSCAVRTAYSA